MNLNGGKQKSLIPHHSIRESLQAQQTANKESRQPTKKSIYFNKKEAALYCVQY